MTRRIAALALALLTCALPGAAADAQRAPSPAAPRAQVLLLGTYHFDNPGLDVVKIDAPDILGAARQAEVRELVDALARFRPTKIAVEVRAERAARLDSQYAAYRAGAAPLGRSEVQQIGFRLAQRLDLPRLHAVDRGGEFPFVEMMRHAETHEPAIVQRVRQLTEAMAAERSRNQRERSVGEILRLENDPARIRQGHALYVELASVGTTDAPVGANLLARWYERNIRILAEVQRIAEPGDRILMIFGAGHAAILRELMALDPRLDLVVATGYLPAGPR